MTASAIDLNTSDRLKGTTQFLALWPQGVLIIDLFTHMRLRVV